MFDYYLAMFKKPQLPGRRISCGTITREALVHDNRWERNYWYACTTVTGGTWFTRICRRSAEKPRAAAALQRSLYRGFIPKPAGTLGYDIIVVPNRR